MIFFVSSKIIKNKLKEIIKKKVEFNACSSHNLRESDKDAANRQATPLPPRPHIPAHTNTHTHTHIHLTHTNL